jgi:hypothetical protein
MNTYTHLDLAYTASAVAGVQGGPWPEKSNVPVTTRGEKVWYLFAWPQNDKLEYDEPSPKAQADPMAYTPERKCKRLILKGIAAPKAATLLRTGEPLEVATGNGTVTIVIPAAKTTKLVDVVELQW